MFNSRIHNYNWSVAPSRCCPRINASEPIVAIEPRQNVAFTL